MLSGLRVTTRHMKRTRNAGLEQRLIAPLDQIQAHQPIVISCLSQQTLLTGLAGEVLPIQLFAHRRDKCAKLALVLSDDSNVFLFLRDQHRNILDFNVENLDRFAG